MKQNEVSKKLSNTGKLSQTLQLHKIEDFGNCISLDAFNLILNESLILAQDERWRRA